MDSISITNDIKKEIEIEGSHNIDEALFVQDGLTFTKDHEQEKHSNLEGDYAYFGNNLSNSNCHIKEEVDVYDEFFHDEIDGANIDSNSSNNGHTNPGENPTASSTELPVSFAKTNKVGKSIKFIKLIKEQECLYNNLCKEYAVKNTCDKAWEHISNEMQLSVPECKDRWKNIRTQFVKTLKLKNGDVSSAKKTYYLAEHMDFVVPFIRASNKICPQTTTNATHSTLNTKPPQQSTPADHEKRFQEILDTPQTQDSTDKSKNHVNKNAPKDLHEIDRVLCRYLERKASRNEDPDRLFLLSLLPDMKKLSERNRRWFKIQTMARLSSFLDESPNNQTE